MGEVGELKRGLSGESRMVMEGLWRWVGGEVEVKVGGLVLKGK